MRGVSGRGDFSVFRVGVERLRGRCRAEAGFRLRLEVESIELSMDWIRGREEGVGLVLGISGRVCGVELWIVVEVTFFFEVLGVFGLWLCFFIFVFVLRGFFLCVCFS